VPVRVFHADDSSAFRLLIGELLREDADDIVVVGGAGTVDAVLEGVAREQPDVVLLDQLAGAGLVDRLRAAVPGLRVVIFSGFPPGGGDPELEARADAYVVKSADIEALRAAVRGG
jgi:DNA-binding NarL/FixJ family response regulator